MFKILLFILMEIEQLWTMRQNLGVTLKAIPLQVIM
jgi:hypothetical protein